MLNGPSLIAQENIVLLAIYNVVFWYIFQSWKWTFKYILIYFWIKTENLLVLGRRTCAHCKDWSFVTLDIFTLFKIVNNVAHSMITYIKKNIQQTPNYIISWCYHNLDGKHLLFDKLLAYSWSTYKFGDTLSKA